MPQPSKILVAAPFHHLESALASRVRRLGGGDPLSRRRVVVISNRLRARVQKLLARAGGFAGVSVLGALDLAREMLGADLAFERFERISPAIAEALAQKAFEDARPELAHFRAGGRSFGRSLRAALTDLAEANLSPGDLRKIGREMSASDAAQCADLARLAEDFRRGMRALKRYDGSSLLEAACEKAEAKPPRVPTIFFGFAEMNALQRRLVKAACREAEAQALVPALADAPACAHALPLIRWFEGLGFAREEAEAEEERPLSPLAAALFSDSGDAAGRVPEDALRIVAAPGPGREAREACREALRAREAAPETGGICVLMTAGSYRDLLRETFETLEIPCRVEEGTSLSAAPAGHLFLLMLQIIAEDCPRAGVMRFLDEGGFVRAGAFEALARKCGWSALPGDPALASKWEFFSRSLRYLRGAEAWRSALDSALEEMREDDEERPAAHSLDLAMSNFFALLEKIPKRARPSSFVRFAMEAFSALTSGLEGREALKKALSALQELDGILGEVSLEEFRGLCERLLETSVSREKGRECLASLSSIQSARGLSFDNAALVGAAEGLFPPRGAEDSLLPDALREEVNCAARESLPDGCAELPLKKSREREARFQFWTILQSVRKRLIITTPWAESEARQESGSFPSAFLDALAKARGEEGGAPNPFTRLPGFRAAPAGLSREDMAKRPVDALEWRLARILEQLDQESPEAGALSWLEASPGFARRRGALNERWRRGVLTAHEGVFSATDLRELVRERARPPAHPLGITSLETFFGCPYRFVNARLRPRMKKRPEPEPSFTADGLLRGRLAHRALERLHRRLLPNAARPLDSEDEASLREALRCAIQQAMREAWKDAKAPPLPALPWGILEDALLRLLWRYVEEKRADGAAWRPVRLEERFGGQGSEPLRVSLDEGDLLLSGRIDLLERHEDGEYRVVDFKTGKAPSAKTRLGGGARLQVDLYARREAGILPEGTKVSGAYVYLTEEDGVVYRPRAGAEIQADMEDVDALLNYFLSAGETGSFFPTPSDACRYCDYITLCGPDRVERARRKEEAAARVELHELREKTA